MSERQFLFGTNFKMYPTPDDSRRFLRDLIAGYRPRPGVQLFLLPPFTSLPGLKALAGDSGIWIGAQTMHEAEEGPFTGEISPRMLQATGADLVMLGHAERRQHFGETDVALQRKVLAALKAGLRVLLCVGENAEEKTYGIEAETVGRQLRVALHGFPPAELSRLLVAYEPVWSIGESGTPASIPDVEYTSTHIRRTLAAIFGDAAADVPLLYGGSVNRDNCADYAALDVIDGLFVGRAAWQVRGFLDVFAAGLAAKQRSRH